VAVSLHYLLKTTTMKKRIVSALAILLISGSVALAQSQEGNKKDIPLVSKKAPGSSEDKKANAKVDPSSSNAKPTKIPEGEKGSTHEKVNSRDREHTGYNPGMKSRSKSDKMMMARKKESK